MPAHRLTSSPRRAQRFPRLLARHNNSDIDRTVLAIESLEDRFQPSLSALNPLPDSPHEMAVVRSADELGVTPTGVQDSCAACGTQATDLLPIRRELILIDRDVPDRDALSRQLLGAEFGDAVVEVVELNGSGVSEISQVLRARRGLDAVHIISHGEAGAIQLGRDLLDAASLDRFAGDLRSWGQALNPGADLLLYGCDTAGNAAGRALASGVAALTGADVAASTDLTGAVALGGDWELEYQSGDVEARALSGAGWAHTLPTVSFEQGVNGYAGTVDTYIDRDNPTATHGGDDDTFAEAGSENLQGLIRFDDIFGNGPGQIPLGSTITSASLVVYVTNDAAATQISFHRMLVNWSNSSTWSSFGGGIQRSGVEAATTVDATFSNTGVTGYQTVTGLESAVQSWSDGAANYGLVFFSNNQKWGFNTSEKNNNKAPRLVVTYTAANGAPTANGDSYTTNEGTPLTRNAAGGVLANDTDPDGDALTVSLASGPTHGTVALNSNGGFTYTPAANYDGTDSFTYTISDGRGGTATGTVSITVNAVNDAPTFALNGNPPAVDEDSGPQTVPGFAAGISPGPNESGQSVTFAVTGNTNPGLFAAGPTIAADGTLTYTPATNANGTATITVVLQDDGGTSNGGQDTSTARTFTITVWAVNDAPTLDAITDVTVSEDSGPQMIPLTGITAGGGETQTLSVTATSSNTSLIPNPAVSYTSPGSTGTLTFTPNPNANGAATITVTVRDAGENGFLGDADDVVTTRQFTVTVTPVPDAPTANPDTYSTPGLVQLSILGSGVLGNDTDPDGDSLTASLVSGPSNGALTLFPDGSFTYLPAVGFSGVDTFTYQAVDPAGNVSAPVTVTINVALSNRAPTATDDAFTTSEDTPLSGTVLGNDVDPDGDALSITLLGGGPAHGALTLNPNGTFTYTPNTNFNGTDSFSYTLSDGSGSTSTATVTLTITAVNDAPTATNDTATVAEDGSVVIGVRANDSDVENDALTVVAVTQPANGTVTTNGLTVTYTPAANFNGTDTFTYTIFDGNGGTATATVTVTVTSVDDAPTLDAIADLTVSEDSGPQPILLTGITAGATESQTVLVTATSSNPALIPNPTVSYSGPGSTGILIFTPNPDASGTATITVTVDDGTTRTSRTFTITVTAVNDGPTISPVADQTILEDDTVGPLAFTVGDAESAPGSLTVTATSSNPALIPDENITIVHTGGGGRQIILVPVANNSGVAVITLTVSDGNASTTTTFTVIVTSVNDAPIVAGDSYTTARGTTLAVPPSGMLLNDTDAEDDVFNAVVVRHPRHGTLQMNPDGSFIYDPEPGFAGTDSFTYRAVDSSGATSGTATVTIRVVAPSTPPPTEEPAPTPAAPAPADPPTDPPADPTPADPPRPPTASSPPPRVAPVQADSRPEPTSSDGAAVATTRAVDTPLERTTTSTAGGSATDANNPIAGTFFIMAGNPAGPPALPPGDAKPALGELPNPGPKPAPPEAPANPQPAPNVPPITAVAPAAVAPAPAPEVTVADPIEIVEAVSTALDKVSRDVVEEAEERAATDAVVTTAAVATAGYVLLNTRAVYWLISALLARPAVWRRFDPIDVIYSWEQEQSLGNAKEQDPAADESLQSMVS